MRRGLPEKEEKGRANEKLQILLAAHGYQRVLEHLVRVSRQSPRPEPEPEISWRPSARYLMTLSPEEREPFLEAAAADALPLYEADLMWPEAERALTADLETGDFYDYDHDYDAPGASPPRVRGKGAWLIPCGARSGAWISSRRKARKRARSGPPP